MRARDSRTELADFRQSGSLKALFPRLNGQDLTCVLLNTAGGIAGGDIFSTDIETLPGTRLAVTSQAAERIYRATGSETAQLTIRLKAGPGSALAWLPQETILYQNSRLIRRTEADLAPGSSFLFAESLVFGRAAMGEKIHALSLADHLTLRRNGELLFRDTTRLSGDAATILSGPATASNAGAVSLVVYAADDAALMRARLTGLAAASLIRPGLLVARFTAPDSFTLRRSLVPVLEILNRNPLPRTWTM